MKIYVSHSSAFDFQKELYAPLAQAETLKQHTFFFPHDEKNLPMKQSSNVRNFDIVLAEISFPSTGQGIELGWAQSGGKPIICMHKAGTTVSLALHITANEIFEYTDDADMLIKIGQRLS